MRQVLLLLGLAFFCASASATETGWIDVREVGGQTSHVFVVLSETVGADRGCPGTRVLVTDGTFSADAQRRFYAAMVVAMTAGKKIRLAVSGCTGNYPAMISTDYWFVRGD